MTIYLTKLTLIFATFIFSISIHATSLRDSIEHAINLNPDIVAEHYNKKESKLDIEKEEADYYPTLNLKGYIEDSTIESNYKDETPDSTLDQDGWNATVTLEQILYDGGKTSQEVEKYTYKFIREDEFEGQAVNVVERTPVYENSGYSKQLVWLDKKRTIPLQIEYFDRKGSTLKTQYFKDYQLYNERFWRVDDLMMINHQKGTQTTISFDNYKISQGVRLTNFAQANLSRIR